MKNKILKHLLIALSTIAIFYLFISFYSLELDFKNWTADQRFLLIIFSSFATFSPIVFYFDE